MRLPALPTAGIPVAELHFSILLLNYGARGCNFFFYLNLLFKSSSNRKKNDNINAKKSPSCLQNTLYSVKGSKFK